MAGYSSHRFPNHLDTHNIPQLEISPGRRSRDFPMDFPIIFPSPQRSRHHFPMRGPQTIAKLVYMWVYHGLW